MRVKDLGSRPASAALLQFFGLARRGQAPAVRVTRREVPYWRERGWSFDENAYSGSFQTRYGAFQGWIEQERSGRMNFYIYAPSAEVRRHNHWTCFQHRGNDWYLIHMAREPRDVSSGIMTIEQLLREAYEQ